MLLPSSDNKLLMGWQEGAYEVIRNTRDVNYEIRNLGKEAKSYHVNLSKAWKTQEAEALYRTDSD